MANLAHYPSWGSGTLPPYREKRLPIQLITPHGDREHSCHGQALLLALFSLPLMGIGNFSRHSHATSARTLITPHGDRELVLRALCPTASMEAHYPSWGSGTVSRGSPATAGQEAHYPSWGSGTKVSAGTKSSTLAHYPSWGSGTASHPSCMHVAPSAHYPSWGSGTEEAAHDVADPATHYPSWGSGTLAHGVGRPQPFPELITPHGDRELTTHIFDPPLAFLITPHGDRERGHRPVNELRDLDSLPLMGIGNPAGKEEDEQHEHLITPHGDRELSGVTTPDGKTPSHYPSWGSGTGASDGSGPRAAEAHYPSWGSGTIGTRPP